VATFILRHNLHGKTNTMIEDASGKNQGGAALLYRFTFARRKKVGPFST